MSPKSKEDESMMEGGHVDSQMGIPWRMGFCLDMV